MSEEDEASMWISIPGVWAPIPRAAAHKTASVRIAFIIEGMPAKITIRNNGSIRVEGEFTITDEAGNPFGLGGRTMISLCRCGHSENKPFCDGAHRRQGFESVCPARDLPPPAPKP